MGLNDAIVTVDLMRDDPNLKVVFRIVENLRVRIDNVKIDGAEAYSQSALKEALETRYNLLSASWLTWLPLDGNIGLLDREALERDKARLRDLYLKKGYLDFKVTDTATAEHPGDPETVDVKFTVEEGEPYTIGTVSFDGNTKFTTEELASLLTLKSGDIYSSSNEDRDIKAISGKYHPLGYADFRVIVVKNPSYETHTVNLDVKILEGTQYRIGEIYISGQDLKTKDHVIRRDIPLMPGDPVDQYMLELTKMRLMGLGYFGDETGETDGVSITAVNSSEPGVKDVHIELHEKEFLDGRIGAGWSDTDSLAGMIEISHSNMDIFDPEHYFTGGGQRMRLSALAGLEHMDFEFDFTEPWLFGIPLRFDFSTYWRSVIYDEWTEQRLGFTTSLTKRVFDDFTSVQLGYTFEQVRINDMARKLSKKFQDQEGRYLAGRVFLNLERDTRNSFTDPTQGYDIAFNTALTTRALGATDDYWKAELKAVNYLPFYHDWFVLMTGVKFGSMGTFKSGDDVPLYDRYFLGGGDSIRGFPYRSIGPVDANEDNYGGQFMYLATVELSHPIYKDYLRGAFFCDVGDVTSGTCGAMNQPNIGVGYGFRIKLPQFQVPIRLDLAYPVLSNQEGVSRKLRFHFNLGFSF